MPRNQSQGLHLLSDEDVHLLQRVSRLVEQWDREPKNELGPPDAPGDDNPRSGLFALVPAGGIPARTDKGDGTYELHGVECQVYQEIFDDLNKRTLQPMPGWEEYVINHGDSEVAAGSLLPTEVTTQGTRFPVVGGGDGSAVIGFRVLSAGPFIYSDLPECENALKVTAEVTEVACGVSGVSVGDTVVIYDPRHCKFDLPIEVLLGALGTAVKMVNTMTSDYGEITPGCTEYDELVELSCRWVVTDLSCCEECYACD